MEKEISDNDGLFQTGFVLMAMAVDNNKEDMAEAANVVAGIPPDIIEKYWGKAWKLREAAHIGLDKLGEDYE